MSAVVVTIIVNSRGAPNTFCTQLQRFVRHNAPATSPVSMKLSLETLKQAASSSTPSSSSSTTSAATAATPPTSHASCDRAPAAASAASRMGTAPPTAPQPQAAVLDEELQQAAKSIMMQKVAMCARNDSHVTSHVALLPSHAQLCRAIPTITCTPYSARSPRQHPVRCSCSALAQPPHTSSGKAKLSVRNVLMMALRQLGSAPPLT